MLAETKLTVENPAGTAGTGPWSRLPVAVRAVVAGFAVTSAAIVPWAVLVSANQRYPWRVLPNIPWCVPVMVLWLVPYILYLNGRGWPRRTAAARRRDFRARRLPARVWGWALLAGAFGMAAVGGIFLLVPRLAEIPRETVPDFAGIPPAVLALVLFMSSIVAGLGEEAGFRGFLQAPLERRYGALPAILITGTIFGLAHASHESWSLWSMPAYLAMSAVLGGIAWRTGSILPGVLLHASGVPFYMAWTWRIGLPVFGPTVWETGPDALFWGLWLMVAFSGAASGLAFRRLGRVVRGASQEGVAP